MSIREKLPSTGDMKVKTFFYYFTFKLMYFQRLVDKNQSNSRNVSYFVKFIEMLNTFYDIVNWLINVVRWISYDSTKHMREEQAEITRWFFLPSSQLMMTKYKCFCADYIIEMC